MPFRGEGHVVARYRDELDVSSERRQPCVAACSMGCHRSRGCEAHSDHRRAQSNAVRAGTSSRTQRVPTSGGRRCRNSVGIVSRAVQRHYGGTRRADLDRDGQDSCSSTTQSRSERRLLAKLRRRIDRNDREPEDMAVTDPGGNGSAGSGQPADAGTGHEHNDGPSTWPPPSTEAGPLPATCQQRPLRLKPKELVSMPSPDVAVGPVSADPRVGVRRGVGRGVRVRPKTLRGRRALRKRRGDSLQPRPRHLRGPSGVVHGGARREAAVRDLSPACTRDRRGHQGGVSPRLGPPPTSGGCGWTPTSVRCSIGRGVTPTHPAS